MDEYLKAWIEQFASDWVDYPDDFANEFEIKSIEAGWDLECVTQRVS